MSADSDRLSGEYELRQVTRDEFLAFFRPTLRDRLHKRLVAARCWLLGHRWESERIDHGPGLYERVTWCGRCWLRQSGSSHGGER